MIGQDGELGAEIERQTPGMVTGFVVFVTFIDAETGETLYAADTLEGQPATTTLGLVEAMAAIERRRIVEHHFDDEGGE